MLQLSQLKAIDLLAASDGTRYVLCGVQVEISGKDVRLVATDGRKLGVLNLPGCVVQDDEEAAMVPDLATSFIISSELIGQAARAFKGKHVALTIERDKKNGLRISTLEGVTLSGTAIDGNYPNWMQVVPLTPPVAHANLNCNASFIAEFYSVSKLLSEEPALYLRGHDAPAVDVGKSAHLQHIYSVRIPNPDFFGVFMPLVVVDGPGNDGSLPAWLPKAA